MPASTFWPATQRHLLDRVRPTQAKLRAMSDAEDMRLGEPFVVLEEGIWDQPRTRKLASILGISTLQAGGLIAALREHVVVAGSRKYDGTFKSSREQISKFFDKKKGSPDLVDAFIAADIIEGNEPHWKYVDCGWLDTMIQALAEDHKSKN